MSDPTPAAATDQEVLITRIFEAPREQVFRAWTDPDEVAAWYGPEQMDAPRERIHIDLRVGGRWELTMVQRDGGGEFSIGYDIVELVEPELIVLRSDPMPEMGMHEPTVSPRGVPRPRRQDAHDAQRRALPRRRRPRRGRLERRLRQARGARSPSRTARRAGHRQATGAPSGRTTSQRPPNSSTLWQSTWPGASST